ncbi:MAG: DUF1648 domain-containing protein [Anaerolineae bacterium]
MARLPFRWLTTFARQLILTVQSVGLDLRADRLAQVLLALALVTNLALFGYLRWRYPTLPQTLPLHFDALGQPDYVSSRSEIFRLPTVGLLILVGNSILGLLLYARERLASHLLWGAALLVQFLFWAATFSILK